MFSHKSTLPMSMTILIPIGQMIFGYLYDIIDANYVFIISGVILLVDIFIHKKALIEFGAETQKNSEKGIEADESKILPELE